MSGPVGLPGGGQNFRKGGGQNFWNPQESLVTDPQILRRRRFIYLGIYWNNHHHLFQATEHVSGGILWANLHLLFWLSLFPFTTGWLGENGLAATPTAVYGFVLLMAAIAYYVLERAIIAKQGRDSLLARAVGTDWKGRLSPVLYFVAIPLAFAAPWIANGLYVVVALLWLIPDPRIERELKTREE